MSEATEPENTNLPLCFVLMPFGSKRDDTGALIEFDTVYEDVIRPAVVGAGMQCVRADEEHIGGIIHKPMFERLLLCDYAVADLTSANANVYYELGIRHAARPWSTVLMFAEGFRLPFDVQPLRGLRYRLDDAGKADRVEQDSGALRRRLEEATEHSTDSPLFQTFANIPTPDFRGLDAESFRDRLKAAEQLQTELATARREGVGEVDGIRQRVGGIRDAEAGVLVDLLMAYRGLEEWDKMLSLVDEMSPHVARNPIVREQRALALNRRGRDKEAEEELRKLLDERGPNSETYGLIGRIYKDRWEKAAKAGQSLKADSLLQKAIGYYLAGFESDWRDPYPGVNAVQLMWLRDDSDPRLAEILPVVRYSARRRVCAASGDYWDFATLAELSIYAGDLNSAREWIGKALATDPDRVQAKSTLATLRRLRATYADGPPDAWLDLETALEEAAGPN
jgi:tetratricopeptide (TPR) repeat protein